MAYRRLGTTDVVVSEAGIDVRAALPGGFEAAEETLRAAIDAGITVFAWDVSDTLEDVEPLIARASGVNRGRLTLVAVLDVMPSAQEMGPQIEAVAARLEADGAEGFVDVIALPALPDAAQAAALQESRERGIVRFVGVAPHGSARSPVPLPTGIDLWVLDGVPVIDHRGAGVIARVPAGEAPALIHAGLVSSVVAPVASPVEVRQLLVASGQPGRA